MKTAVSIVFQTSLVAFVYYMGATGYTPGHAAAIYLGLILVYTLIGAAEVAGKK